MSVCNRNSVIVGNPTLKTSNYPPELNMSLLIALKSKYVTLSSTNKWNSMELLFIGLYESNKWLRILELRLTFWESNIWSLHIDPFYFCFGSFFESNLPVLNNLFKILPVLYLKKSFWEYLLIAGLSYYTSQVTNT